MPSHDSASVETMPPLKGILLDANPADQDPGLFDADGNVEVDDDPTVTVYSKQGIEGATPNSDTLPATRLISIGGRVLDSRPTLKPGWEDVLRVEFDDVIGTTWEDGTGRMISVEPIQPSHAADILDFIDKDPMADFAVHCAAGISRSVAVASFISRALGHRLILRGNSSTEETGNPLVYRRLLAEYVQRVGVGVLDDVTETGIPYLLDTPILQRVEKRYITVSPSTPAAAPAPVPYTFWDRWRDAEYRLPEKSRIKKASMELRLRLRWRVAARVLSGLKKTGLDKALADCTGGIRRTLIGVLGIVRAVATLAQRALGERDDSPVVKGAPAIKKPLGP